MSDAATWLAAIGTIALAIVAVFQDRIRRRLMRPKLELIVRVAPPECHKTSWNYPVAVVDGPGGKTVVTQSAPCYYFRVAIRNDGNTEAREVELFAAGLKRRRADGNLENVERFTPMNLLWAHFRQPFLAVLSPKIPKVCDLAHVIHPSHAKSVGHELPDVPAGTPLLAFDLQVEPNMKGHLIGPGTYRLEVILAASNVTPKKYTLEIQFAGDWTEKEERMLTDGFRMKLV